MKYKEAHDVLTKEEALVYCQEIADETVKKEEVCQVIVQINRVQRGTGRGKKFSTCTYTVSEEGRLVLPRWVLREGRGNLLHYLLHELTHVILDDRAPLGEPKWKHDEEYKKLEDMLLRRHNMSIKRKKAYPYEICVRGRIVWEDLDYKVKRKMY